jgi:hypothetical protein
VRLLLPYISQFPAAIVSGLIPAPTHAKKAEAPAPWKDADCDVLILQEAKAEFA